jgi:nucleotide-binding universal stress UspA family protein
LPSTPAAARLDDQIMPTRFLTRSHIDTLDRIEQLAPLTGLRTLTLRNPSLRAVRSEGAELALLSSGKGAAALARTLLDAGVAVLVDAPAATSKRWRGTIGVGYDGSHDADAAAAIAHVIAERAAGQLAQIDFVHVDTSASAAGESDAGALDERRAKVIEWWLAERAARLPARVRVSRLVGDPAEELADLSENLDLLIVGSRGRAPLRRVLTGSVSRQLMLSCRCPLLVTPAGIGQV